VWFPVCNADIIRAFKHFSVALKKTGRLGWEFG